MGRRDKRTCKGKVFKGSSGNVSQTVMLAKKHNDVGFFGTKGILACRHDQRALSSLHYGGSGSSSEQQQHKSLYQSRTLINEPLLKH